ncbi:glutamine amidotransferase [Sinomicrobium pectinilyticum]|uniref:Glutamine amidotransferase n=2 Tax=Sinomicrobium pectinilyticum TaxID=1084421 RepID=A0A3N0EU72_SINP1|nr:glutamine amidotransferase [Sinomicrobium pectinilyticum]
MNKSLTVIIILCAILLGSCNEKKPENAAMEQSDQSDLTNSSANGKAVNDPVDATATKISQKLKPLNPDLPTIGILTFNGVLMTEVTAPLDVFSKNSEAGKPLFNVITIGESYDMITCEEGLKMFPDYIYSNAPELDVVIVPSAYDMTTKVKDTKLLEFITKQNTNTDYTVSNCAGASLLGATGIADGKKIVTWIGGGSDLQKNYPNLLVQDDSEVSYVEDGKFISSNGNLASYISSLELLEKLTDKEHRKLVESHLYLDRLQQWKN